MTLTKTAIDGVYSNLDAGKLLMEEVCQDCNGAGTVLQGEFDNCVEVPCICVKTALAEVRANEKQE